MSTEFVKLNYDWNAEPNDPGEKVQDCGSQLMLSFYANPWAYDGFVEGQRLELRFEGHTEWRLGATNDEGWYQGQCRFSKLAPRWGEFYEVLGDALLEESPADWHRVVEGVGERHFLFYLRDSTFECKASTFHLVRPRNT